MPPYSIQCDRFDQLITMVYNKWYKLMQIQYETQGNDVMLRSIGEFQRLRDYRIRQGLGSSLRGRGALPRVMT